MHICACVYVHTPVHACVCVFVYVCVCVYVFLCVYVCVPLCQLQAAGDAITAKYPSLKQIFVNVVLFNERHILGI